MATDDTYLLAFNGAIRETLLALRKMILSYDDAITDAWRYGMPFFFYNGKRFCYLWVDKSTEQPYLGVVDGKNINHPRLIAGNRSKMKILLIDPAKDLPVRAIRQILKQAIARL